MFDAHGTAIAAHGTTPVGGKTVQLTIDAAIQEDAENVLKATALKYRPLHESVIVMDPQTNAILADANWPRINANYMGVSTNYASQFNYEPGSTFKVVADRRRARGRADLAEHASSRSPTPTTSPTE